MRKRQLSRNVGVLLDEKTYEQLVEATDEKEVTMSAFIRDLVLERLNPEVKEVKSHE